MKLKKNNLESIGQPDTSPLPLRYRGLVPVTPIVTFIKNIIRICILIILLVFIVAFFTATHGDGFVHPNIKVIAVDEDNNPIQNASVIFYEQILEKNYESNPEKFIDRFKRMGSFLETNDEGIAILNTRFGFAVHYYNVLKMRLFPHIALFSDGVVEISKESFLNKRVFVSKKIYRKEILDEQTILFRVVLEKNIRESQQNKIPAILLMMEF